MARTDPKLRRAALDIFGAALAAADPAAAVRRFLRREGDTLIAGRARYDLWRFDRVFVAGAGKATALMARAAGQTLGSRLTAGLINVKYGHGLRIPRIECVECGHPVPDERGLAGTRRMADLAAQATERDLIVCLISGGASALTPLPAPPVTLADKQRATSLLLAAGANIHELNTVRKHLSLFKGGQFAALAAPATVIALILSDVIGDDLDVIGSGPTVPDRSTYGSAHAILDRFGLWSRVPASVRRRLSDGESGLAPETPKPGDPVFARVRNLVVGSNRLALDAAAARARALGFRPLILASSMDGETRDVALVHAAVAREAAAAGRPVRRPACIVSGGETTVTLRGDGRGGRNQEFVLAAAPGIAGLDRCLLFSAGTDGTDGPTDAAGALADGSTMARAAALHLDAAASLARNDSYTFFDRLGDLVRTGPTGTNVMDIHLILLG